VEPNRDLLSTGVEWHRIEVPGLDRLLGRGILYGASLQGAHSLAGKMVFVVGGGNSAGQEAVFFSNYAAEVIMLVRGAGLAVSMSQYLIAQIAEKGNIRIESWTEVTEVLGGERLERIVTTTRERISTTRSADALLLMIGPTANTSWLPPSLERDAKGHIYTGRDLTAWQQLGDILDGGPVAYGLDSGIWTSPMITWVIETEFGVQYHPGHVRKLLRGWGFSVHRPRRVLARADAAAQDRWHRRLYSRPNSPLATLGSPLHRRSQLPARLDAPRHMEPHRVPAGNPP
jgi:hypothetical protein